MNTFLKGWGRFEADAGRREAPRSSIVQNPAMSSSKLGGQAQRVKGPSVAARNSWTNYWTGLYATPRAWAHKAENLIHAFVLLAEAKPMHSLSVDVHDQALMLAGMGIEVSLKAILVHKPAVRAIVTKKRSVLDARGKALHKTFYSHGLADLARAAGVRLNRGQRRAAVALSQYISWRGRYVIPTAAAIDDLIPMMHDDGLVHPIRQHVDMQTAQDLVERVVRAVKKELYGEKRSRWHFSTKLA